jgi:hypothetical protein
LRTAAGLALGGSLALESRELRAGGASGPANAPANGAANAPASATANAAANAPVALTPAALLDSYVRLRASTDGSLTFGWLDALRYAVIEGEIFPLYRVLAFGMARFRKVSDERYDATLFEAAHYVDIESGELLDTLKMPRTGKVVRVPPYRTGPKRVGFGVSVDESEVVGDGVPRKQLKSFAPVGDVRLQRWVSEPRVVDGVYYVRHEEYGRVTPRDPAGSRVFYREWTQWHGPAALALDPTRTNVPCEYSYAALTSWRPWMEMGSLPGHTSENGRGSKVASLEHLPADIRRLTERVHPDVLEHPERVMDRPPT